MSNKNPFPSGTEWSILNHLSFIDLINFSEACSHDFTMDHAYMQQRLLHLIHSLSEHKLRVESMSLGARNAYIKVLIDTRNIEFDPTIVKYISNNHDLIFPGIEHIIGLDKMGLRAIEQDNHEHLLYVLNMTPNQVEQDRIFSVLFMKYMKAKYDDLITLMPMDEYRLESLQRSDRYTPEYHPRTENEYHPYVAGLQGLPRDYYSFFHYTTIEAYLNGLIDCGDRMTYFSTVNRFKHCLPVRRGPDDFRFDREKTMRCIANGDFEYPGYMLETMVLFDDLEAAKTILDNNDEENLETGLCVKSGAMFDLLRKYGIQVNNINLFLGAMRSGNYDLLDQVPWVNLSPDQDQLPEGYEEVVLNDSDDRDLIHDVFQEAPGYIIEKYFMSVKDSFDIHEPLLKELANTFIDTHDLQRLEILLRLGFEPDDKLMEKMKDIRSIGQSKYPNIHRLLA